MRRCLGSDVCQRVKEALRSTQRADLRLGDAELPNPDCSRRLQWRFALPTTATVPSVGVVSYALYPAACVCEFLQVLQQRGSYYSPTNTNSMVRKTLQLTGRRNIGSPRGNTDRAWIAQDADFEEYERAWQGRQCGALPKSGIGQSFLVS